MTDGPGTKVRLAPRDECPNFVPRATEFGERNSPSEALPLRRDWEPHALPLAHARGSGGTLRFAARIPNRAATVRERSRALTLPHALRYRLLTRAVLAGALRFAA